MVFLLSLVVRLMYVTFFLYPPVLFWTVLLGMALAGRWWTLLPACVAATYGGRSELHGLWRACPSFGAASGLPGARN